MLNFHQSSFSVINFKIFIAYRNPFVVADLKNKNIELINVCAKNIPARDLISKTILRILMKPVKRPQFFFFHKISLYRKNDCYRFFFSDIFPILEGLYSFTFIFTIVDLVYGLNNYSHIHTEHPHRLLKTDHILGHLCANENHLDPTREILQKPV